LPAGLHRDPGGHRSGWNSSEEQIESRCDIRFRQHRRHRCLRREIYRSRAVSSRDRCAGTLSCCPSQDRFFNCFLNVRTGLPPTPLDFLDERQVFLAIRRSWKPNRSTTLGNAITFVQGERNVSQPNDPTGESHRKHAERSLFVSRIASSAPCNDADDVSQDVFTRKRWPWHEAGPIRTWTGLMVVWHVRSIDRLRKNTRRPESLPQKLDNIKPVAKRSRPRTGADCRRVGRHCFAGIRLRPSTAAIFRLAYFEQLSRKRDRTAPRRIPEAVSTTL